MRNQLLAANVALLAAIAVHTTDHSLQERGVGAVPDLVIAGGTMVALLALTSFVLTLRRHPRAAPVAAGVGLYVAVGVVAGHFLPDWGPLSDPYADLDLPLGSWLAAGAEVAAGTALALVALRALRRPSGRVATG